MRQQQYHVICCMDHSLIAIVILTKTLPPQLLHSPFSTVHITGRRGHPGVLPIRSDEFTVSILRAETAYNENISTIIFSTFKEVLG
jgi:hypothetical protein